VGFADFLFGVVWCGFFGDIGIFGGFGVVDLW
jgi:hypothetical protein